MEIKELFQAELKKHAPIDGLICRPGNAVDKTSLDLCGPSLKAISTLSVGFNHIDLVEAKKREILVGHSSDPQESGFRGFALYRDGISAIAIMHAAYFSCFVLLQPNLCFRFWSHTCSPDTVTDTTADTCLALLLAVARLIIPSHNNVVNGEWGKAPFSCYHLAGRDVHHSTVGIVGLGRIGLAVAKRLRGFDCKILYTGRTPKPEAAAKVDAEYVSFDELLARSDFVIPQTPLNDHTRNMFNKDVFDKMKSTAIFINTTRGGVVDQDALYNALTNGTIFAAGLDVTEPGTEQKGAILYHH